MIQVFTVFITPVGDRDYAYAEQERENLLKISTILLTQQVYISYSNVFKIFFSNIAAFDG